MALFTCISCQVGFPTSEGQRNHMKSDWHRYNLKRKVINLPPLDAEMFRAKVVNLREEESLANQQVIGTCAVCQKTYNSKGGLESHLKSKKHLERLALSGQDLNEPSVSITTDSFTYNNDAGSNVPSNVESKPSFRVRLGQAQTEEQVNALIKEKIENSVRLTPPDCLFCTHTSTNLEENLTHMAKQHSFFIPDVEYLADLNGLIQYLQDQISIENVCIYCCGKGKTLHSLEAVRAHMIQKGHCKILYEDGYENDIAQFYKFEMPGDDWEDIDGDIDDDDDAISLESEDESNVAKEVGAYLVLPSGKKIGHRQFSRYWRQNLRPAQIVPGAQNDPAMLRGRLASGYQLMGYKQPGQLTLQQRMEMKVEKKLVMKGLKQHQEHRNRVGVKHNMLQHHYREQNPF